MIVLDASVIIALLNPSDLHHMRATQVLSEHTTAGFRMHQVTLAEVLVDAVRTGRGAQLFDDILSLGVVAHEPVASEPMILAELRATTGLRMPDCCVVAVAQQASLPIATFDDRLAHVAQDLGLQTLR